MSDPRMMSANMFDRAVSDRPDRSAPFFPLPLNLLALIISYLDRPSDLSRSCRTCRVFHYIALPQLYSNVCLRSYNHIRYNASDGRPEGCGMSSPLSMGLNGLVSRNVAGYVRNFEICGEWKEDELEEHAKVGRVPDGSMMLNTLVRIAIERMEILERFSWNLNTKMLPTVWQAITQKGTLKSLTIKFPDKRHPRPMAVVPPIPNLQALKITDIDPLCYADDISQLLLGSRKLSSLTLHWSPRMREAREPSTQPATYFGKVEAAGISMPLKKVAIYNLFAYDMRSCDCIFNLNVVEEITFLNSTGGQGDDGSAVFTDVGWRKPANIAVPRLKMLCIDKVSRAQCEFLGSISGLERLYLLGPDNKTSQIRTPPMSDTHSPSEVASNTDSSSSSSCSSIQALKGAYLDAIVRNHGPTLRHLLLLPQWRLTANDISLLIRHCPRLEQLAIGTEFENFKHLRLLIPFLPKLFAVRFLGDEDQNGGTFTQKMRELDAKGLHAEKIGEECVNSEWSRIKYMELGGSDLIFEVGERYKIEDDDSPVEMDAEAEVEVEGVEKKESWRRRVRRPTLEEVGHIEIWWMESGAI